MDKNNIDNLPQEQPILDVFEVGDAVSDGVYLSDRSGVVLKVNKTYSYITGIGAHEVIGKNMQHILDEKYAKGEYVVLKLEHMNNESTNTMISTEESYITEKPTSICDLVLKQNKEVSIMATLSIKGRNKKILFIGKPYFDDIGHISHVLTFMREVTDMNKLEKKLEEAERKSKEYLNELIYLRGNQKETDLIGKDPSMEKIKEVIRHIAKTDATVLITGETGVGKEVIAREIYKKSTRCQKPYIKVNCSAIPESLIESELFGYEKGAFTGANNKEKLGYFEIANGGTILLDEIGEMPVKLQSKLLRVLQEKEITRIGGTKPIKLDIRVIAATNQDIKEQIRKGTFREDLYYRLNVIPIRIPSLRERKLDIALLAHVFLKTFTEKHNRTKEFEIEALKALEFYPWPGNVRELENLVERLVIIGDEGIITENDVINIIGRDKFSFEAIEDEEITLKDALDKLEKTIIEKALKKYGSSHKAAKALGVAQPTVLRKAKALGIEKW